MIQLSARGHTHQLNLYCGPPAHTQHTRIWYRVTQQGMGTSSAFKVHRIHGWFCSKKERAAKLHDDTLIGRLLVRHHQSSIWGTSMAGLGQLQQLLARTSRTGLSHWTAQGWGGGLVEVSGQGHAQQNMLLDAC
jgi:hypothetical protein